MIPKIIHYCWFGKNKKSELILSCIESWKKYFPDYEIIEWNEDNYDVNKIPYIKEAYEAKKWAFVSDYVRFDILYNYGGLYFDTDVEVLKTFTDEIINNIAFTGVESSNKIAPGLLFACEKNFPLVKEILENYKNDHFITSENNNIYTVVERTTDILKNKGYVVNGKFQIIEGLAIYPSKYFCSYNLDLHEPDITKDSFTIHHYSASWIDSSSKIKRKIQSLIKKIFGINFYSKLLNLKRKIKNIL